MYFQEKSENFSILVTEFDSNAGKTISHTGNSMKIGLSCH